MVFTHMNIDKESLMDRSDPTKNMSPVCLGATVSAFALGCLIGSLTNGVVTNEIRTQPVNDEDESKHITKVTFAEPEDGGRFLVDEIDTQSVNFEGSSSFGNGVPYCWQCDNAPSRGWQWNWGYGTCKCYPGWGGSCCSISNEVEDDRHGPYMGEKGTFELFTQYSKNIQDPSKGIVYPMTGGKTNTDESHNVPAFLHGMWWMNGNPAAEDVASFGQSVWVSKEEGGCDDAPDMDDNGGCSGSLSIECFNSRNWSWEDSFLGRQMYAGAISTSMTLHFYFNVDHDYAQIVPSGAVTLFDKSTSIIRVPVFLLHFDMTLDPDSNGNVWHRNSYISGMSPFSFTYYLQRIVDGEGNHAEYWDDYLEGTKKTVLITKRIASF